MIADPWAIVSYHIITPMSMGVNNSIAIAIGLRLPIGALGIVAQILQGLGI